ncbi:hypothetical protein B0H34DRAFT_735474 [Crassisporium funariophilum]|nr:hypothetical protein B0H34DRAFT_735474 [Crassisporium funariophilum]
MTSALRARVIYGMCLHIVQHFYNNMFRYTPDKDKWREICISHMSRRGAAGGLPPPVPLAQVEADVSSCKCITTARMIICRLTSYNRDSDFLL